MSHLLLNTEMKTETRPVASSVAAGDLLGCKEMVAPGNSIMAHLRTKSSEKFLISGQKYQ